MRSQTIHSENDIELRNEFPKCYPFVKWAGKMGWWKRTVIIKIR